MLVSAVIIFCLNSTFFFFMFTGVYFVEEMFKLETPAGTVFWFEAQPITTFCHFFSWSRWYSCLTCPVSGWVKCKPFEIQSVEDGSDGCWAEESILIIYREFYLDDHEKCRLCYTVINLTLLALDENEFSTQKINAMLLLFPLLRK